MYKKVVFYNQYGAGDIFESREFVKEICRQVEAEEYCYSHGKSHRILLDLPFLKQEDETVKWADMRKAVFEQDDSLYINTWIGRDSRYVLPGIGCTVEMLYKMYSAMGLKLPKRPLDYVPVINFDYYNLNSISYNLSKYRRFKKVLLCNGNVQSNQAANFDFTPIIKRLINNYTDIRFYITSPIDWELPENAFFTKDVIGNLEFDLNEIGYLSMFCDLIVGRCSGPSVFAQHYGNWTDDTKTSLSFTYTYEGSHFVLDSGTQMKKIWSPETEEEKVYLKITEVMDEKGII